MWTQIRLLLGAVWSGSTLFDQEASKTFQHTKKEDIIVVIDVFRVKLVSHQS